ncbi:MAG: L,D-transpeptidase [Bacteroidota bacterium]
MHHWIWVLFLLMACTPGVPAGEEPETSWYMRLDSSVLADVYLKVSKADYTMEVWSDSLMLHRYSVVFGGNAADDKLREGDKCTPEGRFRIQSKYPHDQWSYFLWIDYPTEDSWTKHKAAKEAGVIPADASIGGEIGIHGVPEGYDYAIDARQNWTLGCVSLKTEDIAELYEIVREGTVVWIE